MKVKLFLTTTLWFAFFYSYIQNLSAQTFFSTIPYYDLPFKAEDLKSGERYSTGNHAAGIQVKGEDFGAKRYLGSNKWSFNKRSTNGNQNEDKIIYNKPFYAMEGGVVCGCWRNAPSNPRPGQKHSALGKGLMPGGGNLLWVLHDDGVYALYAHAVPGTIPKSICPNNATLFSERGSYLPHPEPRMNRKVIIPEGQRPRIKKGQYLGRVGNSGNSTGPHLHVHMEKDGKPVTMRFAKGLTSKMQSEDRGSINSWTALNTKELPAGRILIWPPRSLTDEYTRHGMSTSSFGRMFKHLANSGFEPVFIDGYSVGGKGYLNFSWRPSSGKPWKAHFGLSNTSYKNAFKNRGTLSPVFVDSYTVNGSPRYNVIFKTSSGAFSTRHGLTASQHQNHFNTQTSKGLEPVSISAISVNSSLQYTVLYRNKNYGSWILKSKIKESDYQSVVNQNKEKGRLPIYLNAYKHGTQVYMSAIFASNSGEIMARHGLSNQSLQIEFNKAMNARLKTTMITAFDGASSNHRYAAIWKK